MALVKSVIILILMLGIVYQALGAVEDSNRNMFELNFPYDKELNKKLHFARVLPLPQWLCHPKRNSELINSLLGLPKNMNIAGK